MKSCYLREVDGRLSCESKGNEDIKLLGKISVGKTVISGIPRANCAEVDFVGHKNVVQTSRNKNE